MALNDALNKSTLTLHSSKKIGRLLMPNGSGTTSNAQNNTGTAITSSNNVQYSQQQQQR